jgi:hypothetical protein
MRRRPGFSSCGACWYAPSHCWLLLTFSPHLARPCRRLRHSLERGRLTSLESGTACRVRPLTALRIILRSMITGFAASTFRALHPAKTCSRMTLRLGDGCFSRWSVRSFVMNGCSAPNDIHLTDDGKKLSLVLHKINETSYLLTFFTPSGKSAGADKCRRRLNVLGK